MRFALLAIVLYGACALQPWLAAREEFAAALQAHLLVAALALLLADGPAALLWGAAAGFVSDGLSPAPFGLGTAGCVLAVLLARRTFGRRPPATLPAVLVATGAMTLIARGVTLGGRAVWGQEAIEPPILGRELAREAAMTAAVAGIVWVLVRVGMRIAASSGSRAARTGN